MRSQYSVRKRLKNAKEELRMAESRFNSFSERKYEQGIQYAQSDMILWNREVEILEWFLNKKKK